MAPALEARFVHAWPAGPRVEAELSLEESSGPVTILFGPSGSGKSTVLRCLAGLERPADGWIRWRGAPWLDARARTFVPARRRPVSLVFQEYALFPHLSVAENVAFGLHALPPSERGPRTAEALGLLKLGALSDRRPSELSGGQRQRVALARALARRPELLLLDEPLSALDGPAREETRVELRTFLTRLGVPALVVTHDRLEALALGDRMAVLSGGRIRQEGAVAEVFGRPADEEVARCVGVETVVGARVVGRGDGLVTLAAGPCRLVAVDPGLPSDDVLACLRAEDVTLERRSPGLSSARNHLEARVVALTPQGPLVRVALDCGFRLTALVTRLSCAELALAEGEVVTAVVKAPSIHLVPHPAAPDAPR